MPCPGGQWAMPAISAGHARGRRRQLAGTRRTRPVAGGYALGRQAGLTDWGEERKAVQVEQMVVVMGIMGAPG